MSYKLGVEFLTRRDTVEGYDFLCFFATIQY